MGWAYCGEDDLGRPIGYCAEACCDFENCYAVIDRGLSYACGGMHGDVGAEGEPACRRYFCEHHHRRDHHDCPTAGERVSYSKTIETEAGTAILKGYVQDGTFTVVHISTVGVENEEPDA
ncbi:hypothetical protein LCGC14_0274250 [marine sediment metagenome]|uniref:Uncharacterized protein n=2 Tax=root TaxID=1 RepID=A0A9C9TFX6_9HYPH|nr:hypothetical protein [Aurantimonas coralicida]